MIARIVMKDVASYDAEGVVFDNLQEVSIIYGVSIQPLFRWSKI